MTILNVVRYHLTIIELKYAIDNGKAVILVNKSGDNKFTWERAEDGEGYDECINGVSDVFKPYACALANCPVIDWQNEQAGRKSRLIDIVNQYCNRAELYRDLKRDLEQQKQSSEGDDAKQVAYRGRLLKYQCGGDKEWVDAVISSEQLGVSVAYLLDDFEKEAVNGMHDAKLNPELYPMLDQQNPQFPVLDPPNFYNLAPVMAYGSSNAKGFGIECPRDRMLNCSIVDALAQEGKADKATHFLSWTWSYRTSMFVASIRTWKQTNKLHKDASQLFIWCCFFCNNQDRLLKAANHNAEDLDSMFENRLRTAGSMIAMLDTWNNPGYYSRVWWYVNALRLNVICVCVCV